MNEVIMSLEERLQELEFEKVTFPPKTEVETFSLELELCYTIELLEAAKLEVA